MEYVVVALAGLIAVSYAVFIGVSIERGKPWAREMARAISLLDFHTVDYHLREQIREADPPEGPDPEPEEQTSADRLAA